MKKLVLSVVAASGLTASAHAADVMVPVKAQPPVVAAPAMPVFDLAFGGALMSDYNFRGISQSDLGPAVFGYVEPRWNVTPDFQAYLGIAATSVKLATDPAAEVDLYGGVRWTVGPVVLDVGAMYYWYPNERAIDGVVITAPPAFNTTIADTDFWEIYGKLTWTINPMFALGGAVYYAPSWLNTGADGTYAALNAKLTAPGTILPPDVGAYLSGEFGHYWFGTTNLVPGVFVNIAGTGGWKLPDYSYWNVGFGFTYKVLTLDFRYHDTDLSKAECNALTADPGAAATAGVRINNFITTGLSSWCGSAFIVKLSADLTLSALK
jgi:uncharacterized protein (TIGR02001 family)